MVDPQDAAPAAGKEGGAMVNSQKVVGPGTDHSGGSSDDVAVREASLIMEDGVVVNASGHRDQLQRHFGLLAICGFALSVDNAWVVLGTSMTVAISSGGPAGVLYELLVAVFYYSFIAASIAELASAIPSAGGIYHWASVTPGPRAGRLLGFFAGSLNFFGWIFGGTFVIYVMAELLTQMYGLYHDDYEVQQWHLFLTLVIVNLIIMCITIFMNRYLPLIQKFGFFVMVVGSLSTIIVLAVMPPQHASVSDVFVWKDENNLTGWPSGTAFLLGVLNGAFAIGTPDSVTHVAEELPNPRRDLHRAIFVQMTLGTISSFAFGVALFFGVSDLGAVINSPGAFPLAQAYFQATGGSKPATFGLLFIIFLSYIPCMTGAFVTSGRMWWALARDNATPFAAWFSKVDERLSCPVPATLLVGLLGVVFGAITLGSKAAFQQLAGSFIILNCLSYLLAILPNVINRRKYMPRGEFRMPGLTGDVVNVLACLFIVFFNVIFCLPPTNPTAVDLMSYNSVILVGIVALTAFWWLVHGARKYPGPRLADLYTSEGHAITFQPRV